MSLQVQLPDGRRIALGEGTTWVGREAGCALHVDDPRILPRHAAIKPVGDRVLIEAEEGAFVQINSMPASRYSWVGAQDVIRLGSDGPCLTMLESHAAGEPRQAPAPPVQPTLPRAAPSPPAASMGSAVGSAPLAPRVASDAAHDGMLTPPPTTPQVVFQPVTGAPIPRAAARDAGPERWPRKYLVGLAAAVVFTAAGVLYEVSRPPPPDVAKPGNADRSRDDQHGSDSKSELLLLRSDEGPAQEPPPPPPDFEELVSPHLPSVVWLGVEMVEDHRLAIGSGWLAGSRSVVTTADVASVLQHFADQGRPIQAFCPGGGQRFIAIETLQMHSLYDPSAADTSASQLHNVGLATLAEDLDRFCRRARPVLENVAEEPVAAVGYPLPRPEMLATLTDARDLSKFRPSPVMIVLGKVAPAGSDFLALDEVLPHGMLGGPVFGEKGTVIGMLAGKEGNPILIRCSRFADLLPY